MKNCKCRCHWGYKDYPEKLADSISSCSHCQKQEEIHAYCEPGYDCQKQDQPAEWEENIFPHAEYCITSKKDLYKFGLKPPSCLEPERIDKVNKVRSLLSTKKQNLIREVEKKHDETIDILTLKHGGVSDIQSWAQGYDRAISDVLSLLKEESR